MIGTTTRSDGLVATAPVSRRAFRAHSALAARELNFTPVSLEEAQASPHWRFDELAVALPTEPPGAPKDGGAYAVARDVTISYEFADPAVVRAVYDPASPLEGRDMLLVGRFHGLRFHMGVRVGGVAEGPTTLEGRSVHRVRWHYRTLEGHLERGHMDYAVLKWMDTGEVEFRIRAYSQRAAIRNPVVRLGFELFGRRTQVDFYRRSLARMRALVTSRLAGAAPPPP